MKIGLVSAILAKANFYEMVDAAAAAGYSCVEVACWPRGKAERRYAGVTHIDVDTLDAIEVARMQAHLAKTGVSISALGYYPNTMGEGPKATERYSAHLLRMMDAAVLLGVPTIATFVGREQNKTVEENLALFAKVWPPLVAAAKERGLAIAIENCPMLFTQDEWPGGKNLATTPAIWRQMFDIIPDANFGLNYDPSHCVWQQLDVIAPIYEFASRLHHVHFKDIRLYQHKLAEVGVMAPPLSYMRPVLVGQGDVDWGRFVCALNDVGYTGCACVEIEDKAYEGSEEAVLLSLKQAREYLKQFLL